MTTETGKDRILFGTELFLIFPKLEAHMNSTGIFFYFANCITFYHTSFVGYAVLAKIQSIEHT